MHKCEIIIYWSNDDQAFIAEVPELLGCLAHGKTPDDALANCKDTAREFSRAIPEPKGRRLQYG
jgi:predicted RNase H-like HicB family nuclease